MNSKSIAATATRVLDWRCSTCGPVFNAWAGTVLRGMQRRPAEILRGFAQGVSTVRLSRKSGCDRMKLLALQHQLLGNAQLRMDRNPLGDAAVEADEMYQNAGGKVIPHPDPADPPRHQANKRRGHGTFANDRPPVVGIVGRESGVVRLEVISDSARETLEDQEGRATLEGRWSTPTNGAATAGCRG
jgi:hypothetical protein